MSVSLVPRRGSVGDQPFVLGQSAAGWILPGVSASSTVAQTGTTVTVTNGASVAHNIPATTYDGYQVYFPGSASIAAGWYSGFSRTGAATYTFTAATATVASESVNGGAAYTSETTAVSVTVPGGALGASGRFICETLCQGFSSANNKTIRARFGAAVFLTNSFTTSTNSHQKTVVRNREAAKQVASSQYQPTSYSTTGNTPTTSAIDTAVDVVAGVTLQCSAAAEFMTLEAYSAEVSPS